ncbi:hypothetical protein G3N56_17660 [Desulfovibrio sulfodismutans]|uniref:Uncharacterized protein n=1 Tax=Desulfolutivibrio sulfodismutans TaxID=63561 RepID=A0A7K3NQS3_9BACT|nr:hypothetical protein [Desulfolutivibrio sulfodismutans]NDY58564.1 hypothetical protein [Desulfolutivibrio sulfodismutans]QLA13930.1 hypothetical protein GD606_17500 [Desulfolutivibrio sulfodismutans DSM 3696]
MVTFWFDVIRRSFVTAVWASLAGVFLVAHDASAMKVDEYIAAHGNKNIKVTDKSFVFGDLSVENYDIPDSPMESSSKYFYKGKLILTDEFGAPVYDLIEIADDYPMPGMKTIVIAAHSGFTAHGWSYHIFVMSSNALYYTGIETDLSGPDTTIVGNGLLDITHHSGNSPSAQNGDMIVSFYTATHPRYTRYVLFENGKWRTGRYGELKESYDSRFREASARNIDINMAEDGAQDQIASNVAEETYYCIMSGRGDGECKKYMNNRLPKKLRWVTNSLYVMVKEDVDTFNGDLETKIYK